MLRCVRVRRSAVLRSTVADRSELAAAQNTSTHAAAVRDAPNEAVAGGSAVNRHTSTSLAHVGDESDSSLTPAQPAPETQPQPRKFLFQGRRGSSSAEYYVARSNAGHPDAVAELLGAGRPDSEWMWLKLLCFFCVSSTFGTTLYGYFFAEHIKYFKDEPWSPFTY
ncbi:hypothetical protein LSCM1_02218 [Leishmania martiniquensis]|uniref:Uncharacterized protein n=1 Tax=Leishmania martiniquensis TaxID=1580590 RepID=A0A836GME7_9TRYP|nr:hypothetical protein LSCM1_02218 [Leishmania martiniquensis]